jgi:hypothetical protein
MEASPIQIWPTRLKEHPEVLRGKALDKSVVFGTFFLFLYIAIFLQLPKSTGSKRENTNH